MPQLHLDPDRALPPDPATRELARTVYAATRSLPLVCMHGHVDAALLADDTPFRDPAAPAHHPRPLRDPYWCTPPVSPWSARRRRRRRVRERAAPIWRTFCAHWRLFRGTPSRFWLDPRAGRGLRRRRPSLRGHRRRVYDELRERLAEPGSAARALFERFGIEVLATTDAATRRPRRPRRLAGGGWGSRVPRSARTPRPPARTALARRRRRAGRAGRRRTPTTYDGYLAALRQRRQAFVAAGALATDHGHQCGHRAAARREAGADLRGGAGGRGHARRGGRVRRPHALPVGRDVCEDGLVMQLTPACCATTTRVPPASADRGFDIPVAAIHPSLRPLLEGSGTPRLPDRRCSPSTRPLLPRARPARRRLPGACGSGRPGGSWTPRRHAPVPDAVTETAGFYNTAGFVDDTRAFASIPARHDLARRSTPATSPPRRRPPARRGDRDRGRPRLHHPEAGLRPPGHLTPRPHFPGAPGNGATPQCGARSCPLACRGLSAHGRKGRLTAALR